MPLPTFAKQEEIPEAFRAEYEERDGKWQAKEVAPLGDGGKKALDAERKAREDAERKVTDAERRLAEAEQSAKAQRAGITDEQLSKLRDEVRVTVAKEFEEKLKDRDTLATENRSLKLDHQVRALALANGVRPERVDAWWKQHGDRFDLTADGKPMVKASPGSEVTKFIAADLKKELPELYVGTRAAGSGADSGKAGAIAANGSLSYEDFQKLPPSEKMRYAREHEEQMA